MTKDKQNLKDVKIKLLIICMTFIRYLLCQRDAIVKYIYIYILMLKSVLFFLLSCFNCWLKNIYSVNCKEIFI